MDLHELKRIATHNNASVCYDVQWRIQGGGGELGSSNTPLSIHFINYSLQSVAYNSLHDTAQLAPAPSEKVPLVVAAMHWRSIEREAERRFTALYTRIYVHTTINERH